MIYSYPDSTWIIETHNQTEEAKLHDRRVVLMRLCILFFLVLGIKWLRWVLHFLR